MADPIVISQLRQKRKEIERAIHELETKLRDARGDLSTINSTLRIFGEDTGEPRKYVDSQTLFHSGELIRICYDALRGAPDGLDTSTLADLAMAAKGYRPDDKITRARVKHSVTNAMLRAVKQNRIARGEIHNGARMWRLSSKI
jgi:hypothetical protein